MIWVEALRDELQQLQAAALAASATGLKVTVGHAPRLSSRRQTFVRAWISEDGNCACSLLREDADWNAESWSMREEMRKPLTETLELLMTHGPGRLAVQATWIGDCALEDAMVSKEELIALAAAGQLGTRIRYNVERAT